MDHMTKSFFQASGVGRGARHGEGRLGGERDDRHALEVGAAVARRLEAEALELGRDVFGRGRPAPGAGGAALERIVGQELEMGAQDARIQGAGGAGGSGGGRPRLRGERSAAVVASRSIKVSARIGLPEGEARALEPQSLEKTFRQGSDDGHDRPPEPGNVGDVAPALDRTVDVPAGAAGAGEERSLLRVPPSSACPRSPA